MGKRSISLACPEVSAFSDIPGPLDHGISSTSTERRAHAHTQPRDINMLQQHIILLVGSVMTKLYTYTKYRFCSQIFTHDIVVY